MTEFTNGSEVLIPARDTTEGGSRLGKVVGVLTRVQVERRDGTVGYEGALGISKSWASRHHTKALTRLRVTLRSVAA